MTLALHSFSVHNRPFLRSLTWSATACRHVREHLALKKKEREIAFDAEKGVEGAVKQAELDSAETAPLQAESAATAAAPAASEPEPEPEPWLEELRLS